MKISEVSEKTSSLIGELIALWEKSARATHLFLPESVILNIKENFLEAALKNISHLVILKEENRLPAFMGIEDRKLEMLFLLPKKEEWE